MRPVYSILNKLYGSSLDLASGYLESDGQGREHHNVTNLTKRMRSRTKSKEQVCCWVYAQKAGQYIKESCWVKMNCKSSKEPSSNKGTP